MKDKKLKSWEPRISGGKDAIANWQMLTSIGANFFESVAASSKRDFMNYFTHALKSANETKFWLALLRDANLIQTHLKPELEELIDEKKQIANILASSILTIKGKRNAPKVSNKS